MCETLHQKKQSLSIKVLHNLHGYNIGFHFIAFLNSLRLSSCFISWGKISQVFGPRNFIISVPLCTYWIWKSVCFLNWYGTASLNLKMSFTIWGFIPLKTLNISIARNLIFCWWMETEPSLSKSFSKFDFLPLYIMSRHRSYYIFDIIFDCKCKTLKISGKIKPRKIFVWDFSSAVSVLKIIILFFRYLIYE